MRSVKLQGKEAVVVVAVAAAAAAVVMALKIPRESPAFQECLTYTLSLDRTP
jgi:hypothetical protein